MDRRTVDAYEGDAAAERFLLERKAYRPERAEAFAARTTGLRVDIGSGVGHYTPFLGEPLVSLDASHAMLRVLRREHPGTHCVQADLAALPLRRASLGGAWAARSYQHIEHDHLPLALADLHRSLELDAPIALHLFVGDGTERRPDDDSFPGRLFAMWDPDRLADVIRGAGFEIEHAVIEGDHITIDATRARMLPDLVRPGLRVLFCGFNPSLYAADTGVAFGRPGNRFWPAALESGLLTRDRDPWYAVRHDSVGWTDLVKRATVAAAELSTAELRDGFARVERLCEWLQPELVCLLGVGGWRDLVNRKAIVGWQPETVGGRPVYVMPNPSGLNASTQHAGFVDHLRKISMNRSGRSKGSKPTRS